MLMVQKGSSRKLFSRVTLVVCTTTLYNIRELACYTCLPTLEDIMADKLAEERFCSKGLPSLQQSQLHTAHLSARDY